MRWAIYSTTWMPYPGVREGSAGEREFVERAALQTTGGLLILARDTRGYK